MTTPPAGWFKSTHSGSDNCVEVLIDATGVRVRHSRHPAPVLVFTRAEWLAFVAGAVEGEFTP